MLEVIIPEGENFERALKRFILSGLRRHRHYEKPSEQKKRQQAAARRHHEGGPARG